jgi:signal transduction histidine kinase
MNYATLINERLEPDSPLREYARAIESESERVAEIVRNLLAFSRRERQDHTSTDIRQIIESTVSLFRTTIGRDQISLRLEMADDLPKIKCRSQQIQQVLMNLLTNARDALNARYVEHDDDKMIIVTVGPYEHWGVHYVRTTVEDHGTGISVEIGRSLFDPFFTTKEPSAGTGLGLSISHSLVQDHHGELSFECEQGRYTRFHIDLPVDDVMDLNAIDAIEVDARFEA